MKINHIYREPDQRKRETQQAVIHRRCLLLLRELRGRKEAV